MIKLFIFILLLADSVFAAEPTLENRVDSIYGKDDRLFVSKDSNPLIRSISESVAIIIPKGVVEKKFLFSQINADLLSSKTDPNLCLNDKFVNHHSIESCSAFLISEDLVATAGHCFNNQIDCSEKVFAFNVQATNENQKGFLVMNSSIYECKEIIKSAFDDKGIQDFAIIRLKKKVKGRTPLKLRRSGVIKKTDQVFMIGHPLGLPLVITNNALINDVSSSHSFKATLDAFEGNSGSPVFNSKSFEVEGILVRGEEDFLEDETRHCNTYQVYNQGSMQSPSNRGEGVNRISDVLRFLKP